ncbi:DddA-like double-stranded DNA deaminase toxin [Kribbella deserti]|uniref:DddA-like double-stranded DNA deaminase toxin n=1 Tax=Kribbella deserti TaxID=1926257 RepID=A0ABV6QUI7_9ACTN
MPPAIRPDKEAFLRRLPVRKQKDRTTGIGMDEHGRPIEIVSGYDDLRRQMLDLCAEKGWPRYNRASHVEIKYALMMWRGGLKDGKLFINNQPCKGDDGTCDKILPAVLPPGSKLTIYGQDGFEKTYEAEESE